MLNANIQKNIPKCEITKSVVKYTLNEMKSKFNKNKKIN